MADKSDKSGKGGWGQRIAVVFAGLLVGGSGAVGIQYAVGAMMPAAVAAQRAERPEDVEYVEVGKIMVPVVDHDGDLMSYLKVEAMLEVPEGTGEEVKVKLPVVIHEINMVTWRTALSAGPDGRLVDTNALQKIFAGAAARVYGKDVKVERVLLTSTIPA